MTNGEARATLSQPNWLTGYPDYMRANVLEVGPHCAQRSIVIKSLPYRVYADSELSYDITGMSIGTKVDACVYSGRGYEYAKYIRWYYANPSLHNMGAFSESGVAVRFDNQDSFGYVEGLETDDSTYLGDGSEGYIQYGNSSHEFKYYKNLESHISTLINGTYILDDRPDYVYRDVSNNSLQVTGIGVSANKKWVSFGVANFGIIRLNLDTFSTVRVGDRYDIQGWTWPVPILVTSISDDGRYLVTGGTGAQTEVIDIRNCGSADAASGLSYHSQLLGKDNCPYRDLTELTSLISDPINSSGIRAMNQLQISPSGDLFTYWDNYQWNTLYAPNYLHPGQLRYLSLGDSYASGEGDITADGLDHYFAGTNVYGNYTQNIARETCHLSTRSYSMRIASAMQLLKGVDMQSVACAGAVTQDILSAGKQSDGYLNSHYLGQSAQLISTVGPRLSGISNAVTLQNEARQDYTPGRVQQIEFVKKAKPQYMTVMVGGNDLDFGGILAACASNALPSASETCDYAETTGMAGIVQKVHDLYPTLLKFYEALHEVSPKTVIYVIGYPQFIDENSETCKEMLNLYSKPERKTFHQMIAYANAVIKNAALDAGAKYIDISDALTGGKLCDTGTDMTGMTDVFTISIYTEYMKSLTMSDGNIAKYLNIFPTGLLHDIALKIYLAERAAAIAAQVSYSPATAIADTMQELSHPNSLGHEAMYETIKEGLGEDLLESDTCNQVVSCPNGTLQGQPDVSKYVPDFALDADDDTVYVGVGGKVIFWRRSSLGDGVIGALAKGESEQFVRISSEDMPQAVDDTQPIVVELHSQPIVLGAMTHVGAVYELKTSLPQNAVVGQHVLHIKGKLTDGRAFDLDTPMFVEGPIGDIDDDGIADVGDTCAFGSPSGIDKDSDGIDDACDLATVSKAEVASGVSANNINGNSAKGLDLIDMHVAVTQGNLLTSNNYASTDLLGANSRRSQITDVNSSSTDDWSVLAILLAAGAICTMLVMTTTIFRTHRTKQ